MSLRPFLMPPRAAAEASDALEPVGDLLLETRIAPRQPKPTQRAQCADFGKLPSAQQIMRPIMLSGHERALTRECTAFSSLPFSSNANH